MDMWSWMSSGGSAMSHDCCHSLVRSAMVITLFSGAYCLAYSDDGLTFHRATRSPDVHARNPGRYERIPGMSDSGDTYVEKDPGLMIPLSQVAQVSVSRQGGGSGGFAWIVTVMLPPEAAARFAAFAASAHDPIVDVRLSGTRLSTPRLVGPFGGESFALSISGRDERQVRAMLAPLKDKTIWP